MEDEKQVASENSEIAASEPAPPVYIVTTTAPPKIDGRRVKAGDELKLSEAEALHHLRSGHVRKKGAKADQPKPDETGQDEQTDPSADAANETEKPATKGRSKSR